MLVDQILVREWNTLSRFEHFEFPRLFTSLVSNTESVFE